MKIFLLTFLSILPLFGKRTSFLTCCAEWDEASLTIGNNLVERKWQISRSLFTATSPPGEPIPEKSPFLKKT